MNIATEPKISGKPIDDKPRARPVRMVRWFIIVGLLLALLVGGLVGFNAFRSQMIAQFFANNKPPPATVTVSRSEVRSGAEPVDRGRRSRRRASGQRHLRRQRPHHRDHVHRRRHVEAGTPLLQLFDAPEQGDLASFKAQAIGAQLALDRAKQLASRQFGPQATVDPRRPPTTRPWPASPRPQAIISQKLVRAPFDGELGVRMVEVGQYLSAGTQIVSLTDLSSSMPTSR